MTRALAGACLAAGCAAALGACAGASTPAVTALDQQMSADVAAVNPVAVSPQPGALDASPVTQISFLGGRGTTVARVRVRGSRSGLHRGVVRAYSTGTGASFLPAKPFLAGERVSVTAAVTVGGRLRQASTTFTVAHQASVSQEPFPHNAGDPAAVQRFASAPSLSPSTVTITHAAAAGAAPGLLFLAPYQGSGAAGPLIADQSGQLVWFRPLPPGIDAANFGVQSYAGSPALVWWQGRVLNVGFGEGEDVVYDSSYRRVASIRAGNGYSADLHEIRLTPEGTAWIDSFDPIQMNLSSVHGLANGVLLDSVVQQIDIRTGLVMWEWHALGHIPASESQNPAPGSNYPWDYVHLNSIDPGPDGDVLMSVRNTWALYDVDIHSGSVRWRLGGNRSSFTLPPAARFYWQHDARLLSGKQISLFDNASTPPKERQSRGLVLQLDARAKRVTVARSYANPARVLLAASQGSMQTLDAGNALLGYGSLPNFTEVDAAGQVLLDGTLGRNVQSFNASVSPWRGTPAAAPAVAVLPGTAGVTVAASWNGATGVATWRVLGGPGPGSLTPLASAPRRGFETQIALPAAPRYVAVQALDGAGAVMATSPAAAG
jgi:hypothetical protein